MPEEERAPALAYNEQAMRCVARQDKYAENYNNALLAHMNSLDDQNSIRVMVNESSSLLASAKQLERSHAEISPVPDAASADFAAWNLAFVAYTEWANCQHSAFLALAEGRTPVGDRVAVAMAECQRTKAVAENESKRFLKRLGLSGAEIQRLFQSAYAAIDE